jgi:hypothetical protein
MYLGYVAEVHVDGGGGAPYSTVNLEGCGKKEIEGQVCSLWLLILKIILHPMCHAKNHQTPTRGIKPRKIDMLKRNT